MTATDRYLAGQLLVAMPGMADDRFARTVIYLCAHSEEGAMGLIVNRLVDNIDLGEIIEQLEMDDETAGRVDLPLHFGGPVEIGRGFVLHSAEYTAAGTMPVDDKVSLSASLEVLRDILRGGGPSQRLFALGYAGWGPGQLEDEIRDNGWLLAPADEAILFGPRLDEKWQQAFGKLGIDPNLMSGSAGTA